MKFLKFLLTNMLNLVILAALAGAGFFFMSRLNTLDSQIQATQAKLGENKTVSDDNNKRMQDLEKQAEDIQKDVDDLNADIDEIKAVTDRF